MSKKVLIDKRRKWNLSKIKQFCINKGGILLNSKYETYKQTLWVQCNKKHIWPTKMIHLTIKGRWCPICNLFSNYTLYDAQQFAKNKGGECLSEEITKCEEKLSWKCKEGHVWKTTIYKIKNGKWCAKCARVQRHSYEDVDAQIKLRGWELLSLEYKNQDTKLEIKCGFGHFFKETYSKITGRGFGCKICDNGNISERICKLYFETIFNENFSKTRDSWLNGLELDGYCDKLGIAFEHNGPQHYSLKGYKAIYHSKTQSDFDSLLIRDKIKQELCEKYGVKLIIIPELFSKVKLKDLKTYIKKQCDILDISIPNNFDELKFDLACVFSKSKYEFNYDEIYQLYIIENLTVGKIAKKLNVKKNKISNFITNVKIKKKQELINIKESK